MFCDLGLPTFNTYITHESDLRVVLTLMIISLSCMHFTSGECFLFRVLYVVCSYICLSVCFLFILFIFTVSLLVLWAMLPNINLIWFDLIYALRRRTENGKLSCNGCTWEAHNYWLTVCLREQLAIWKQSLIALATYHNILGSSS